LKPRKYLIITEAANMRPVKACAPRWTFSFISTNW